MKNGFIFPLLYLVKLKDDNLGYCAKFTTDINNNMKG